jgi:hypothetical protein
MLVDGLVSLLNTNTAITTIVGNRIRPIPAPEDIATTACITYQVASESNSYTLTGGDGVTTCRIVFTCFAPRYKDARTLALAVKTTLSGYSGTLPDGTYIHESEIANLVDGFDDGSRVSRTSIHVLIQYAD